MKDFDDFEVLNVLGSCCYKVINKKTSEIFVWKTLTCNDGDLLQRIERRKSLNQSHFVYFYDCIYHESSRTHYMVTEFCKYGSLDGLIHICERKSKRFGEDFVWNLIYKLAMVCSKQRIDAFTTKSVFIDANYNVKLMNFTVKEPTVMVEGDNVKDLCNIVREILKQCNNPSNELRNLLHFIESDGKATIQAILYHPALLFKQNKLNSRQIFATKCEGEVVEKQHCNSNEDLRQRLANLRKREIAAKLLEEKLDAKSHELDKRERKLALMERIVKEKTSRAELYLKQARNSQKTSKINLGVPKENFDTSYSADCGDSVIIPTSRKLNVAEIAKPVKFTRSMSERRVRFKSHSPLKEIHNIKREAPKVQQRNQLLLIPEQESDKTSESNSEKSAKKKKRFVFSAIIARRKKPASVVSASSGSVSAHTYEDLDCGDQLQDCRPISWNEETKKHAFDLLRMMNEEDDVNEIQHTFL